jgi:hypothetical protein
MTFTMDYIPISIDKSGVWFKYNGDEVCRLWRKRDKYRYISLLASGNGDFGDASFEKLKDIDNFWKDFEDAMRDVDCH